ncbi:vacuolar-sorting protein SNF8-like [Limulus polyphemus]|uniref:Vacuolar-sorting protein SNF8 n=1 Tax=Limulus polyphemus TaxID=6850 RepID=A0ABM1BCJ6_LIMPO|nr:vacuolar-sorting protein SNF8-like [Limulus polyphemus]XP_022247028.1 vacuolar-sorting protein SNF8-like [Limulus polyphemus]XP_022247029.1 vacuolar-sorting protein SNF8-like [Limulus polyphemus]
MRRRVGGVGAIQKQQLAQARFRNKGSEIAEDQLQQMTKQMEVFRTKLQEFASNHKNEIRKDPYFRCQFQEMCATVGVDPLASSKGFWAKMLGVGDFYYELGVQIIEVCIATSHQNGGIIGLDELREKVMKSRGSKKRQEDITQDDLLRAIDKLSVLGKGFRLIPAGNHYLVQSVPAELNMDHTTILQQAEGTGFISLMALRRTQKWGEERAQNALEDLVKEGMAWVDDQAKDEGERLYWFPGLLQDKLVSW